MRQPKQPTGVSQPTQWADGAFFLGLALLCGLIGGTLGFVVSATGADSQALPLRHGILLDMFVMPVALLGGIGRWLLPARMSGGQMTLPALDRFSAVMLAVGAVLAGCGPVTPNGLVVALLSWCAGLGGLAASTILTVLEDRPGRFRELPVFVWSQCLGAAMVVLVTPVIAGLLTNMLIQRSATFASLETLLEFCRSPMLVLSLVLSLGLVGAALRQDDRTVSPYLVGALSALATVAPLAWTHGVLHHDGAITARIMPFAIALPALLAGGLWCVTFWRERLDTSSALLWACGALVLCMAGSVSLLTGASASAAHSAALFGAVFAVFAGYYAWFDRVEALPVPRVMGFCHFLLAAGGVALLVAPGAAHGAAGNVLLGAALIYVLPLSLIMLVRRRVMSASGKVA